MSSITIKGVAKRVKVSLESLAETECINDDLLQLAGLVPCDSWKLIGSHLKLSDDQLNAIDGDNTKIEEKRSGMLREWREAHAYDATYLELVRALVECRKVQSALEVCQFFKKKYCQSEVALGKY